MDPENQSQNQSRNELRLKKAISEEEKVWKKKLEDEPIDYFAPALSLREQFEDYSLSHVDVKVLRAPEAVAWEDSDGNLESQIVQPVEFEGMEYNLFLSSVSLERGIRSLWQREGSDLIGKVVRITRRTYTHKKYGPGTPAYNCSIKKDDMEE